MTDQLPTKTANSSGTSTMNSEHAFATFRVAGDELKPEEVTELLGRPTLSYAKGQKYTKENRGYVGRTGVWYISTDELGSNSLQDHIHFLIEMLGSDPVRLNQLRRLIQQKSLHAVLTLFWSGPPGARAPSVPEREIDWLLSALPVEILTDFQDDKKDSSRRASGH
jgi:hypothetical protein